MPARGRSVTVRSEPRSVTRSRSGASAIEVAPGLPARAYSSRRWSASWVPGLAQRLIVRRSFLSLILCVAPVVASRPGSTSPTGIAWAPRCTATLRMLSSQSFASSGLAAAAPSSEQRSIQRGPLMPTTREIWAPPERWPTWQISSVPHGPSRSVAVPPDWATSAAILGRASDQRSPLRGAAKARSSSAPSGPAMTTDCTTPLASSTWRRSSRLGSGAIRSEPRSTRSTSLAAAAPRSRTGRPPAGPRRRPPPRLLDEVVEGAVVVDGVGLRLAAELHVRSLPGSRAGSAVPKPPVEP